MRVWKIVTAATLLVLGAPDAGNADVAASATVTERSARLGPRIINFKTTLKVIGGAPGLEITAVLKPDEHAPPGRVVNPNNVKVTFNERTLRHSLYSFDPTTGAFRLVLDVRAVKILEATHPLTFGMGMGRGEERNALNLTLTDPDGQAEVGRSLRPLADYSRMLLGVDAPSPPPGQACLFGRHGAPGQSAARIGLKVEQTIMPSATVSPAQVEIKTAGPLVAGWVTGGDARHLTALVGSLSPEDQTFAASAAKFGGVQDIQLVPERAFAASIGGPSGRGDGLLVQGNSAAHHLEIPRFYSGFGAFYADNTHVVMQRDSGALEAFTWDGKSVWKQDVWPKVEREGVEVTAGDMMGAGDGGVLVASAGRATVDDLNIPFLAVRQIGPDGIERGSSVVLDPSPGEYGFVEDVRVATLRGRVFAVVTSSRSSGYDVLTRIYDMASPTGTPALVLEPSKTNSARWFWGAEPTGDRLAIGRGDGGVTLLAPVRR
ncbi:MAG: hypothetical protein JWM80_6416 [Cyanobacteria bacterium RYN_339]|nr:hypothetical protein [Cyanobacteria bacterium RYN_339]